ncbi:sigma-70 family RNA polymerase sigma factor [Streptomyces sp. NPDC057445]|uniref:sigma-70 family RNA polymerase sigma factor n=1 Tax=Streptomyces sp. NPDC057445 TaxID=3346136 RepID=UPI0036A781BE
MSGDGRDEPLGGATGPDTGGSPHRQVPSQGGPGHAMRGRHAARPPRARDTGASVPPQRGGRDKAAAADRQPSDADLIQRMRDGDDGAYEELFRRHAAAVRRYARTCCRDVHTADDLTAEVFARMLQAVRGGAGPEQAVRAYLLTTVRRVAAAWTKSSKREQLVEDFAVFADRAARVAGAAGGLAPGADVRAMHDAERSLAMQAFRSLPERWQTVLWHTTVEKETPGEVAPLLGLTANATAVLASRAREGLRQAYLQAHVSAALTSSGDCARYADRLGAYARGSLRMRAERGLRKHLDECARCRLAAGELEQVNEGIPALLPVAVIGWFAAGHSLKAAGIAAGGVAGGAGAGAAVSGTGSVGAADAGGSGSGASGEAAFPEGPGAQAKAGLAAAAAALAAAAGLVFALSGALQHPPEPEAKPPAAQPVVPEEAAQSPGAELPDPSAPAAPGPVLPWHEPPSGRTTGLVAARPPAPDHTPDSTAAPDPTPDPDADAEPRPGSGSATAGPRPTSPTPTAPTVYQVDQLDYRAFGDHTEPEVRLSESSWLWQRQGMSIGGTRYGHGVSVHARSSITIDLNRACGTYSALVGVDDTTPGPGPVRFAVYGDGARLWQSPVMRRGDAAVPVSIGISGRGTIRLAVERHTPLGSVALADWARARISCG